MTPDDARHTNLYSETVRFFGDEADALTWLSTQHPALGKTPLECLGTREGEAEVRVLLCQLSYGIYP